MAADSIMVRLERYRDALRDEWDGFVERSRSGTFLHRRAYMEYHADRFVDHSLLLRAPNGDLLAVLPANERDGVLESHGGLTWGGLLFDSAMTLVLMLEVVGELRRYLHATALSTLRYRAVPHVYRRGPAEEDLWALVRHGARLVHRAALAVVEIPAAVAPQNRRRRGARKARAAGLAVAESGDLAAYWDLLAQVLRQRYGARPVHSLAEMSRLRELFPGHIRLRAVFEGAQMVAGVVLYDSGLVLRTQYIAAGERGKALGALDLLFEELLATRGTARYLDLGTSEGEGLGGLNIGVAEFKEGWGARAVAVDTYELAAAPD
jgi:hypothetical protein